MFLCSTTTISQTRKTNILIVCFQLAEELEAAKTTYVALNGQLVDELPILIQIATDVYNDSVRQFVLARKLFVGRITKELLQLMDVSCISFIRLPTKVANIYLVLEKDSYSSISLKIYKRRVSSLMFLCFPGFILPCTMQICE